MKTITIRNMPAPLRRKLEKSAAAAGLSASAYIVRVLKQYDAEIRLERTLPSRSLPRDEWLRRVRSRTPVTLTTPAAEIIRKFRGPLR